MTRYVVIRLLHGIVALLVASIIIFSLARLTGNPLDMLLEETATEEEYEEVARHLGLDKPLNVQYLIFIKNCVKGDFGKSLRFGMPVSELIFQRLPATLKLAGLSALFSFLIALPAGVIAALRRDRWEDFSARTYAMVGQSLPSFWLGIVLIQIFAVKLGWFPAAGSMGVQYWVLPAFALGYHSTAGVLRLTRSAMLDVISSDYVRLARIKGVSERVVVWKHALKNALIPVVTFSGVIFTHKLMGSVVTETIFAWPGVGRLSYQSIVYRDFPLIQGLIMTFVAIYIVMNLTIDILYIYLDPRIRYVKE